ncbi:lipid IV(A) 3-deoxy-D-manno-octulosonic acid transferase [Methylobacillus gramineus]|uniref:lipid IV(A) 3-deoxy-D-manno-octulosonic acid transferase n=1 Tax=Methylobacillus gramineus TaxID=755169 RepID=UPI001CFF76B8|nr:lipid IV(A) 3-deoxy-D-manno-octulosonic acid transferase [Methylobacillus gramineus]MCB5185903.1 lipid IV(A) 3-deoxy-D-manno-octulosonic acid transferase [Methylobacillus gramineus]
MPRLLYSFLIYLLLPFSPLRLLWRGVRQREYLHHWGERFGFFSHPVTRPVIWMHCVSVGETRGAAPLISELQLRYPQYQVLITHATPTGREAGEQLFGDSVLRAYLPYDTPGAVARFLRHFQPKIGLLMETELWFNLIAGCKQRQIPILLVNARLSAKSAYGYAKVGQLVAQGLHNLTAIAAQTEQDAKRLRALGAINGGALQVEVMGNLKFDVTPPPQAAVSGEVLRSLFGKQRPVFLAASTRDGEESMILDAVAAAEIPHLLTVIVPRHPQRFDEVAQLLNRRGIHFLRRSRLEQALPESVNVVLGDSMGEMFAYYAACDVALIGGSLQPLGGQNLIEASAMSKPVLIGPHTFNFEAATELAIAAKAAWRVMDVVDLARALTRLYGDPELRQSMSWKALEFSTSAGGATQRIADLVGRVIRA